MSFTAESDVGEYKHRLTYEEMPAHGHGVYIDNTVANPQIPAPKWTTALQGGYHQYTYDTHLFASETQIRGDGISHNNVQPSKVVYFWQRVN